MTQQRNPLYLSSVIVFFLIAFVLTGLSKLVSGVSLTTTTPKTGTVYSASSPHRSPRAPPSYDDEEEADNRVQEAVKSAQQQQCIRNYKVARLALSHLKKHHSGSKFKAEISDESMREAMERCVESGRRLHPDARPTIGASTSREDPIQWEEEEGGEESPELEDLKSLSLGLGEQFFGLSDRVSSSDLLDCLSSAQQSKGTATSQGAGSSSPRAPTLPQELTQGYKLGDVTSLYTNEGQYRQMAADAGLIFDEDGKLVIAQALRDYVIHDSSDDEK